MDHLTALLAPSRVVPPPPMRPGPGAARRHFSCCRGRHYHCRNMAHTARLCEDDRRRTHYDSAFATLVPVHIGSHLSSVRVPRPLVRIRGLAQLAVSHHRIWPRRAPSRPFVHVDSHSIALTHEFLLPDCFVFFTLLPGGRYLNNFWGRGGPGVPTLHIADPERHHLNPAQRRFLARKQPQVFFFVLSYHSAGQEGGSL